ncbi:uncharacterized protein LOC112689734 [Sipha flava]|uniref:Uncharacterized protein LOC112689734 n=1 Tax=Sipha flava TaxID=143950 RepID=A0A2S2R3H8_9HEMI|nr:uncharacterized protein LOC112689734 [Sipha flava]
MTSSKNTDAILQHMMITVALVLVMCTGVFTREYNVFDNLQPGKDPRCHYFNMHISRCKVSLYPIFNYTLSGWFYHAPFKSCRPMFSPGGIRHCEENLDLPLTKDECEEICGEKCPISTGQPGICMMEEYCRHFTDPDLAMAVSRHCHAYNVKCCPPRVGPLNPLKQVRVRQQTVPPTPAGQTTKSYPVTELQTVKVPPHLQ